MTNTGTVASRKARAFVLAGTALGCSLGLAQEAAAQSGNITYNGPGPYTLTRTTPVSGGPRAIDVTVTSSDATVDTTATTVTSTNTGTAAGVGIGVSNTGTGNVVVRTGDVTANGSGPNTGIDVRATTGTITIANGGTINASGNNGDRAIVARSGGGNVVINSTVANGQQYGIIVTGNGGTFGDTGTTTITSTTATAGGTGLVNAIVGQGNRVVINSGTASNTNAAGNQGTAIFANASTGGVLLNAGTTTALGQNQAAIQVFSEGAVDVTSGAIRTTQNSDGLSIQSGTDVVVRSTSIMTEGTGGARGLVLGGNSGGGGFNGGPNGFAYNSATVTSGSITTAGNAAYGIYVTPNGAGSTTINSGAITTTGANANGIFVTSIGTGAIGGPVTINSTGALQTSGANAHGIRYAPGTGSTGLLSVNNSGTITTGGNNALGMFISNANGFAITSNAITTTGTGVSTAIQAGAIAGATNPITITSGTINVQNAASSGSGINVTASTAGATTITSGAITIAGASGGGIFVNSPAGSTGDVTITSGDITLSAPPSASFRPAISVFQTAGTTTINSTGTIQSGGSGILLQARAGQPAGAVAITSNVINSADSAISVGAGSSVAIKATNTATSGAGQAAISVVPTTGGAVTVQAGTVTTTGANAIGVNVSTNVAGTTNIAVGTATTTGSAVDARTVGDLTVTSGTARVAGSTFTGLTAISSGGNATVNSTDLAVANGRGIFAQGRDNASVTTGTLAVTGAGNQAIFAQTSSGDGAGTAEGVVTVDSKTLTSDAGGINAYGPRASVTVNSGSVVAGNGTAIGAFGINSTVNSGSVISQNSGIEANFGTGAIRLGTSLVNSGTVTINGAVDNGNAVSGAITANNRSVTVNSGTIVATGLGNRYGISVQGVGGPDAPGDVTVNSGSITTTGNGAYGIQAIASAGAVTVNSTGTITTTGTTQLAGGTTPRFSAGIIAVAQNGPVAVTSNNVTTSGAQADGIRVEAGSGINSYGQGTIGVGPVAVTTTGLTQTAGANAAGINIFGGGGAITVANTGTITTGGTDSAGIATSGGIGATTITSNVVTTAGDGARGIFAQGTDGTVAITATTTRTTGGISAASGNAADAIVGITTGTGAVGVTSGTASASNGNAILVRAGGAASVTANSATATGATGAGVLVTGGTGVTLDIANASSAGATAAGAATRSDAISATALSGGITARIGSASATGAGSDGVHLVANGTGGQVSATVNGSVSATGGNGIFIDPPGTVTVTVATGASVSGSTSGLNVTGGNNVLTNLGSITSSGGPAILASGPTALDNRGTIAGANGIAVQLGASDDSVTLRTGSAVTGRIVGGGGTDRAVLIGSSVAPIPMQSIAGFDGFASLAVQSGYWTANTVNASSFGSVTVASGSTLELQNGANGVAITTPMLVDNGTLVVRSSAASAGSTFGATAITGTGGVTFTGTGTTTLNGTNTLGNTGTNLIDGGIVLVTGTQGGNFVTGTGGTLQVGTGGTTGTFTGNLANNGTLIVNRSDDSSFAGALTGAGLFVKQGAGRITFGTGYAFTGTTQLNGGSIRLTGPVAATTELDVRGSGQIDFSGTNQTIAELSGNSAAASVNIAGGSLTVNQATITIFAGALVGAGSFTKGGTGTLNLTGTNTYTGPTTINAGRLAVNGSIVSPVTVNSGGTLAGTGSVGSTTVASGGTWAPGNSIGTQTVNGNVTFAAGSIYQVEANAAGASDRINATGTATLSGGTVQVLAESGTYNRLTNYTILTAGGGVNGRFAAATSNFAFLTPLLGYSANAVTLTLARNDIGFGQFATTPNQSAVATAVQARGVGDPLFNAVLFQSAADAGTTFGQLTGELHASLASELTDNGRRVREAVLDRGAADAGADGLGIWAQGLQSYARSRQQTGLSRLHANRTGGVGGIDYTVNGIRFGVNGSYQDDDVTVRGQGSANVETTTAGVHVAWVGGPIAVQAGASYAWHDVDTRRTIAAPGLGATVTASPDANSAQLFAEIGYRIVDGPVTITPFVRNAYTWTRVKAFTETGGTGALSVARERRDTDFATAGVRIGGSQPVTAGVTLLPRMSIAYSHGFGDLDGVDIAQIGGSGPAFAVRGASLGKDSLTLDGGFDLLMGQRFSLGVGAFASTSRTWADYGAKVTAGFRF